MSSVAQRSWSAPSVGLLISFVAFACVWPILILSRAAVRSIVRGLRSLQILKGRTRDLVAKESYRRWFMHGTSHWLGMDVHDCGGYHDDEGKPRRLRPGMVLTIEPGLYFSAMDRSVPKKYRGIGIRIVDDVLVTPRGCRVLTSGAPKEIREIESLRARALG